MIYLLSFVLIICLFFFVSSFFNGYSEFYRRAEKTQGTVIIGRSDIRFVEVTIPGKQYKFIYTKRGKRDEGEIVDVFFDPAKLNTPNPVMNTAFTLESEKEYFRSIKQIRIVSFSTITMWIFLL